jgi:hypothetical protein
MDNQRVTAATQQLKQCKSQGLNYYDAKQTLAKMGFSQEEVEQASYQFPYSDVAPSNIEASPSDAKLNQVFSEAVAQQETKDNTKQNLYKDAALGFLGGRSLMGKYYGTKAISDYTTLKDLEQSQENKTESQIGNQQDKTVFQRNRAVRYYTILTLLPVIFLAPYFIGLIRNVPSLLFGHHHIGLAFFSMYLWSLLGCVAYLSMATLLLLARRESSIIKGIYIIMGLETIVFVAMAIVLKSMPIIALGVISLLPGYYISRRVGLLSQLHTDNH